MKRHTPLHWGLDKRRHSRNVNEFRCPFRDDATTEGTGVWVIHGRAAVFCFRKNVQGTSREAARSDIGGTRRLWGVHLLPCSKLGRAAEEARCGTKGGKELGKGLLDRTRMVDGQVGGCTVL